MGKIKTGCTAIVIDGAGNKTNIGKIVTVGVFIGKIDGFRSDDYWEVDRPIKFTDGTFFNLIEEKYLDNINIQPETFFSNITRVIKNSLFSLFITFKPSNTPIIY